MAVAQTSRSARTFDKAARARPREPEQGHPSVVQPDAFVTLLDLKRRSCRWPVNSPAPRKEYYFCGAQTDGPRPYCKMHCTTNQM